MKRFWFFFFFSFSTYVLAASPSPTLIYTISPLKKGDFHSFTIRLEFQGSPTGTTLVSVPFENGPYRPQDQIDILSISNSNKHQVVKGDSGLYQIVHKPNARLTLLYSIKNALKDSIPGLDEVYAQMLTDKYFYWIGNSSWIVPRDSSGKKYAITLKWKGFPTTWTYLNSFDANRTDLRINSTLDDFQNAIYLGGDIRIHTLVINKKPLYFGIRGQWSFSDDEVLNIIHRTVSSQRSYWNDYEIDQFMISLIPMKYHSEEEKSINGRALLNSFVTVGTNNKSLRLGDMTYLYNHELMHHWIGTVLKQGEPENAFKWFSEGFTDYFAHIVMLESGLVDQAEYRKTINHIFAAYYADSNHQWPNAKLEKDYWSSAAMNKLPYQRGLIFALYLNESIKYHTNGKWDLKEVVIRMLREARQDNRIFSQEWLLDLLQKSTGKDYSKQLDHFITNGNFISITDWEEVSGKIALLPTEFFDLGFATDKGGIAMNARIISIREGANVQKAGLRTGDIMVGYSSTQQPTDSATLVIMRGDEKIRLRFLPSREVLLPQLK